jgi:hypothetical protein
MSSLQGAPVFASRPAGRWPGRPLLVARLREVLHREFGAGDAWVVHTPGRCRLEARDGWRTIVLYESAEESFWAPFYTAAVRNRFSGGTVIADLAPTQRRRDDLVEVLRPLWAEATGRAPAAPGSPVPPAGSDLPDAAAAPPN